MHIGLKYALLLAVGAFSFTSATAQELGELAQNNTQDSLAIQLRADSIAALNSTLKQQKIEATLSTANLTPIDTLQTTSEGVQVVLFSNNQWKYIRDRAVVKDSTIFEKHWSNTELFPYSSASLDALPFSTVIDLVDSINTFHYPYKGALHPNGKYGIRRGRRHQGIDMPLKTGDPIYATFGGKVRIANYNRGGYGHLVVIRHDNGLETYYGHLSERLVEPNQWVEAGQVIGLGGSTGRSTGPHLHFEVRYYGQSFDPQRIFDFENGYLLNDNFLLKKSFFSIHSKAGQDFEDEIANDEQDKKEAAEYAARKYHKIKSGDTLGHIAARYGTTVKKICALNNITTKTTLRLGRTLRVQ